MKLTRALQSITELVVLCCDPDEVIIFGSHAKGSARPDSDLDLLVVGDFKASRWLRSHELATLLRRFPIKIDAHLLTPAELEEEAQKPYTYLNTLRHSAMTVYQREGTAPVWSGSGD